MRLRGVKVASPETIGDHAPDHESLENVSTSLKRRPQRAVANKGNVSTTAAGPESESGSSLTGSESDIIGHQYSKATRTRTAQLLENDGDDFDSDRPIKRTRLSLGRALTNAPVIEDEDTDDTPVYDEAEVVKNLTAITANVSSDDDADDVLTDLDDVDIALLAPSPNRPQASSPVRRGGKRQRGGRGNHANSVIGRGRLPGTPKRGANRDDSLARGSPGGLEAQGYLDRLPGRRRAHHADIDVEVDLRRQLELRIAYRAIAKALKPILAELADRTAQEQRANAELYKQCPEYQEVLDELEEHLNSRLALLQTEHDEEESRLQRMYKADLQIVYAHYEQTKVDLRDDSLLACQYQFLRILHEAGIEKRQADTAAMAENTTSRYSLQHSAPRTMKPIDQEHMQRQHLTDTFRNWENLEHRFELALAQTAHDPESYMLLSAEDAITEEDRWEAEERAETAALLQLILDAAAGVKPTIILPEIIPNSDAFGLNLLADAMLMTPPGERTKDVHERQTVEQPPTSPRTGVQGPTTEPHLTSPIASKLRSPPITPRSQPFVPTISAIMNDPEPTGEDQARSVPLGVSSEPGPEKRTVEEHRPRKRPAAEMAAAAPRTQTPTVTIEPLNAPARQAMSTQTSSATSQNEQQSLANVAAQAESPAASDTQKRVRRRPGPRAIYTKQTAPDIVTPSQQYWSPFTNSMGPPTYMPKYVRDGELQHHSSTSDSPATVDPQERDHGERRESMATPILDAVSFNGTPRAPPSEHSVSLPSVPVTSPPIEQRQHHRAHSNREDLERESRRRSSRSVHPEQITRQHAPAPAPPAGPYHWPHQNIYYQPQTFYGPYSPAPGAQHVSAPPPAPQPQLPHIYGQQSAYPATAAPAPRYPPPPASYHPWPPHPHSVYQPPPAGSDSRPTKTQRQSSSEHSKDRRQSGNALPSISTIIPPSTHRQGTYHYPPMAHAWPHPLDPHRKHGAAPPPHDYGRHPSQPHSFYPAYTMQEDSARRNSHVPLLTQSTKPLPSYVQGRTQDRKRSAESTQDVRSPPIELQTVATEHRAQATEEARRRSRESAASIHNAPHGRPNLHHQPQSQPAPPSNGALTAKPPNVRAATTATAAPATPAQQAPIQHPTFKGQRPKHHEWRNWTSAVPPPSSGANNSQPTPPVSVVMIGATNSAGPYSTGNRKRRSKGNKAPTPVPEASASAPPVQETQAPPPSQQVPNPWHREFRFESQNKKFEDLEKKN